jgi:ABC-type multidrug transport system fused ATPase/permease subunit
MSSHQSRHSSEYSPSQESSGSSRSNQSKIKVTDAEKKNARTHLYRVLFHCWKALVGIIPCAIQGGCPILMFLVLGSLMTSMSDFGNIEPLNITDLNEIQAANATRVYYTQISALVDHLMGEIELKCVWLVLIAVLFGVAKFFDSVLWIRAGSEISIQMKDNLFRNMMHCEVAFFDVNPIGSILTLLSEDAQLVQDAFGTVKGMQFANLFQFLLGIILNFTYSWRLALIALCCLPLIFIIISICGPFVVKNSIRRFANVSASMTIAEETISCIRTVRGFNQEDRETKRFLDETVKMGHYEANIGFGIVLMIHLILVAVWAAALGNLYYGSTFVGEKENGQEFTTGRLFSAFGYSMMGSFGVVALMGSMQGEEKAISAGARILKLTNHVPDIPFEGGEVLEDFKGDIEFRNVSFKYPTRDAYVLRNVSWHVKPGQTCALVGHSGSGKSTSVQLIERFYDVEEGIILLDGHDIRTLDPRWLHHKIALVSQEPTLFKGSIRDNILYGAEPGVTDEDVQAACEVSNSAKFISKLTNGLDQEVGEKGNQLSGGQRQRVAIARAVIKNPVVLITDEATSALDSGSEKKVQIALDKVMEGRTAVIVAHRLSTIRNANIIYVFDAGEIKEVGTHESLVKKGGWYYNLVKRQLTVEDNQMAKQNDTQNIEEEKAEAHDEEPLSSSDDESNSGAPMDNNE